MAAKTLQEKLFRGGGIASNEQTPVDEKEGGLTIDIPRPPTSPNPPQVNPMPRSGTGEIPLKSYRERLASKLADDYKGVERYRLLQDATKERHWKRWGPYLSDRQWASCF